MKCRIPNFYTVLLTTCLFFPGTKIVKAQEKQQAAKTDSLQKNEELIVKIADRLHFVSQSSVEAVLFSLGRAANLIEEANFVQRVEDFVYIYEKRVGWYPKMKYASGSFPAFGATAFMQHKLVDFAVGGYYSNQNFWKNKVNFGYTFLANNNVYNIKLAGEIGSMENLEFYGFGHNPKSDSRNIFLPTTNEEHGEYIQKRSKVSLVLGIRPLSEWQFFVSSYFSQRRIKSSPEDNPQNIENVFDLIHLPGADYGAESIIENFYSEFVVRYDTRYYSAELLPGFRAESYLGLSEGLEFDQNIFGRAGFDVAGYITAFRKNHLLVPRLVCNATFDLSGDNQIPFAEYSRHTMFRGVSTRTMLRTDKYMLIPSLEYQWPLTQHIRGHLFYDALMVSSRLDKIMLGKNPYAVGIGFDFHKHYSELGRVQIAYGSEGVRATLTLGLSGHTNNRNKWK